MGGNHLVQTWGHSEQKQPANVADPNDRGSSTQKEETAPHAVGLASQPATSASQAQLGWHSATASDVLGPHAPSSYA